jgi:hypothetical protein
MQNEEATCLRLPAPAREGDVFDTSYADSGKKLA